MVAPTSSISSPSQFTYDPRTRRYRATSGRFISAKEVRQAVDVIIDKEATNFRGIAQQLIDGTINLAEFQIQMQANVKRLNVAMALAANGGINNTSPGDLGYIAGLVKEQYKFLRGMAKEIKTGKQPLDGTLLSRVALYAQASRGVHEKVRVRGAKFSGLTQSRSVLAPADHCSQCLSEAKRGWVPIGENIPIGQRICGPNCHCTLEYR